MCVFTQREVRYGPQTWPAHLGIGCSIASRSGHGAHRLSVRAGVYRLGHRDNRIISDHLGKLLRVVDIVDRSIGYPRGPVAHGRLPSGPPLLHDLAVAL